MNRQRFQVLVLIVVVIAVFLAAGGFAMQPGGTHHFDDGTFYTAMWFRILGQESICWLMVPDSHPIVCERRGWYG